MAKWIDAKKRLPKEDGEYLVFHRLRCEEAWPIYLVANYDAEYREWQETSWGHGVVSPSHWMHLPKPPPVESEKGK